MLAKLKHSTGSVKWQMPYFTPLSNDRFLNLSKLKGFADDKINVTKKLNLGKGRKHCGKRRKCWLPAFSPFPTMFSKGFFHGGGRGR